MLDNESILGSARTRIEAKRTVDGATVYVTEQLFETKVKPLLDRVSTDFLQNRLPSKYLPLIEEIKKFIEQKEGVVLESEQAIFYFDTENRASSSLGALQAFTLTDTNLTINDPNAGNIMDSWRREERKKWVDLFESDAFWERLGVGVYTRLTKPSFTAEGMKDGWHFEGYVINVGLICFNENNDKFYSNRLAVQMGSDSRSAGTNSEEEMNEFLERMALALDSRKYLAPEHLVRKRLFY